MKKPNFTKAAIVDRVANETGITKLETEVIVDGFLQTVKDALMDERKIELRGFGTFKVKLRKPRVGRNPKTGERVDVEALCTPLFKVSKNLRIEVNGILKQKNNIGV